MRRLARRPLSPRATSFLLRRTQSVTAAPNQAEAVKRLWRLKNNNTFLEIVKALSDMASGRGRCMYCEDNAGTDIDHHRPKATYPLSAFVWLNYLLACSRCNSNFKRDAFPLDATGQPLLIDPTAEDPYNHLTLSLSTGEFVANTPKGEASIQAFGLSRAELTTGRKDAWITLCELLPKYAALHAAGESPEADQIAGVVRRASFSGVLFYLLKIVAGGNAATIVPADVLASLQARPEIAAWV